MRVIEARNNITVNGRKFVAGSRYVANDGIAGALLGAGFDIMGDAAILTRQWQGCDLYGKTVIVHCAMGIGDEFLAARLSTVVKSRFNAKSVRFACFDHHHEYWPEAQRAALPFEVVSATVPLDDWRAADYHVIHEGWWESFKGKDQPDVWQTMGLACGIEFAPDECRPFLPAVPGAMAAKTIETVEPWLAGRPLVLWALGASSRIRSYPPENTRQAMRKLITDTGCAIVAFGHPGQLPDYEVEAGDSLTIYSGGIPGLIALIQYASTLPRACLVTPDSAAGHIAACFPALRVLSLWSSFDPAKRVARYPNHRVCVGQIKCSPCYAHETIYNGQQTAYGCPLTACNDYCAGLRTIKPDMVAGEVEKILAGGAQ